VLQNRNKKSNKIAVESENPNSIKLAAETGSLAVSPGTGAGCSGDFLGGRQIIECERRAIYLFKQQHDYDKHDSRC